MSVRLQSPLSKSLCFNIQSGEEVTLSDFDKTVARDVSDANHIPEPRYVSDDTYIPELVTSYIRFKAQVDGLGLIDLEDQKLLKSIINKFELGQFFKYVSDFSDQKKKLDLFVAAFLDQDRKELKKADDLEREKAVFNKGICRADSMHPVRGSLKFRHKHDAKVYPY